MSVRSWLIAALAVAILVAGIILVWKVGGLGGRSATTATDRGKQGTRAGRGMSGSGPARIGASAGASETGAEPALPDPLTREERQTMEMEHLMAGEVPRRVRTAAAGCYDGSEFSYKQLENEDKEIELSFTVVLENGQVTLRGVELVSGIGVADLEQCVVETVSEVTWRDPVNADFSAPMTDSISLLALKKYGAPMPHELEEVPETPEEGDFGPRLGIPAP